MEFDVIVIGGGPSGSAAATRLAAMGWETAVVEQTAFPRRKVCGEYLSWTNWDAFRRLGVWSDFDSMAGPPVRRVALFARRAEPVSALLPAPPTTRSNGWGRGLTRDRLDSLLLSTAEREGARLFQPWTVARIERDDHRWRVAAAPVRRTSEELCLSAPILIQASGSWSRASWSPPIALADGDLLGFKAHFTDAALDADLMPLLAFPGGYGGMATVQQGLVSLSCCVRRGLLRELRSGSEAAAGEAVLKHIRQNSPALDHVLKGAARRGSWLAAGPIRPGLRQAYGDGLFRVGNAAGEAHPVVAEGVSMAVQSGVLAAECITVHCEPGNVDREALERAGDHYRKRYHRAFSPRICASKAIAAWAMREGAVRVSEPAIKWFPSLLTLGARFSGKSNKVTLTEQG